MTVNTRDQIIPITSDLILNAFPAYLFFQNNTIFEVKYNYKNGTGLLSSYKQHIQISLDVPPNEQGVTPENINTGDFNSNSPIQVIGNMDAYGGYSETPGPDPTVAPPINPDFSSEENAAAVYNTAVERQYSIPTILRGPIGLIKTNIFLLYLEENFFRYIRALQSEHVTYKQIEISILMPLGYNNIENVSMNSYSIVDTFKFLFRENLTGLLPSNNIPKVGALELLLYPLETNPIFRRTSMAYKPSRILLRGCAEPLNQIATNINFQQFRNNFTLTSTHPIYDRDFPNVGCLLNFTPKINILNDLFNIDIVQCGGYIRVAGQRNISPVKNENVENFSSIEKTAQQNDQEEGVNV